MVNKCSCRGCLTNYSGGSLSGAVFGLPKEGDVQDAWLKFVNREKEDLKHVYVCEYHFEEKYLNRNKKRARLIANFKLIPTLLSDSQKNLRKTQLPTMVKRRNPPKQINVQEDELQTFRVQDRIKDFSDINDSLLVLLGKKVPAEEIRHPCSFLCFRDKRFISTKGNVLCPHRQWSSCEAFFMLVLQLPCPNGFLRLKIPDWHLEVWSRTCTFIFKEKLKNMGQFWEELGKLKLTKKPVYSANLISYALVLLYSSLSAYKQLLTEFNLPSVPFLRKLTSGKIDALSSAKLLKSSVKISEDVILMFDEIYLQKCEEY